MRLDFGLAKVLGRRLSRGRSDAVTHHHGRWHSRRRDSRDRCLHEPRAGSRTGGRQADRHLGVRLAACCSRCSPGPPHSPVLRIRSPPSWSTSRRGGKLPAVTSPGSVRRLLERCLEKDPKRRLRDIGDAGMDIDEALLGNSAASAGCPASDHKRVAGAWTVAAALFVVSAALAGVVFFAAKTPEAAKITFLVGRTPSTYSTPAFQPLAGTGRTSPLSRRRRARSRCCGCARSIMARTDAFCPGTESACCDAVLVAGQPLHRLPRRRKTEESRHLLARRRRPLCDGENSWSWRRRGRHLEP